MPTQSRMLPLTDEQQQWLDKYKSKHPIPNPLAEKNPGPEGKHCGECFHLYHMEYLGKPQARCPYLKSIDPQIGHLVDWAACFKFKQKG